MSRLDPKNREDAFCYQFEDDVRVLKCHASGGDEAGFEKMLQTLEVHIAAYRNKNLRKKSIAVAKKHKEQEAWLNETFPHLKSKKQ